MLQSSAIKVSSGLDGYFLWESLYGSCWPGLTKYLKCASIEVDWFLNKLKKENVFMICPAEFVVHRRLMNLADESKLKCLGCPSSLVFDIAFACHSWAVCFREREGEGVSVERFLKAADFAVIQAHREIGTIFTNYENIWRWLMRIAKEAFSVNFVSTLEEKLRSSEFQIQLVTIKKETFLEKIL